MSRRQNITVKKNLSLAEYYNIIYLAFDYFQAMRKGQTTPEKPLPELSTILEAFYIVKAYLAANPAKANLKVWSMVRKMDQDKIVAVWLLWQTGPIHALS